MTKYIFIDEFGDIYLGTEIHAADTLGCAMGVLFIIDVEAGKEFDGINWNDIEVWGGSTECS